MGKVIIPDNEVWAWNGSILKPNPEHFEEGHTTGATGKKPRHDQFNYTEQRRDLNLQYLLRMAGLPYDPLEVYPIGARASKNGHMYVSLENNNKGNDPISSGKWKHEDDDKFPVGTVILNSFDSRNPNTYKGFGDWSLVEGQTTINMVGVDDDDLGIVSGNNEKQVPIPRHKHTIDHNHGPGTMNIEGEIFGSGAGSSQGYFNNASGAFSLSGLTQFNLLGEGSGTRYKGVKLDAKNGWTGVTSGPSVASSGWEGENDASINVQSKSLNVLGWIRVK